ncbi:hypothetical protein [Amycolatopsis sp. CA-230715]|uniref:hypothetical protein n=1 Tax=Amycolatopsis sp. CA-230715 TaxID=2745196 RepID=UPI001C0398B6|nr:hypothetical protein [Amycolatopsis sp. CA-230715]QWF81129.1 hypothetical protein HUW46_04555 [Amycolatopsis sp. CA-230715]
MRSDEIASLITEGMAPPAGNSDIGFHQGVVESWDDATGVNSVSLNGAILTNLRCLSIGPGILLSVGDVVALLRFQQTYFILGKIAAPGAGAALGLRSQTVTPRNSATGGAYADLPTFGPTVTCYISKARRALVIMSATMNCQNGWARATTFVSGASSIDPEAYGKSPLTSGGFDPNHADDPIHSAGLWSSCSQSIVFTAADGLNEGQNTFTMKYRRDPQAGYTPYDARFEDRTLTVIPF